jgi:hypothetical protein
MTRQIDLARWQPHIEEARGRGVSLKAYAAAEGVSLWALYRASQAMRAASTASTASTPVRPAASSKFSRVRVSPAAIAVQLRIAAQLPNGVSVQLDAGSGDLAAVIAALGALPCSA